MSRERFEDCALRLRPEDNVAVLKCSVTVGTVLDGAGMGPITVVTDIAAGHKVALEAITDGQPVRRYGQVIGFARRPIVAGEHVHTHNVAVRDFERDYQFCADAKPFPLYGPEQLRTFPGYLRPDGRVGTRNYVAIISTVNCSASVSKYIVERFRTPEFKRQYPNVDGVIALTHQVGCGIPLNETTQTVRRVFGGMARHPNIFGYVMLGLGCEVNQVHLVRDQFKLNVLRPGEPPPAFMTIQQQGGTRRTVEAVVEAIAKLLPLANAARRTSQPLSKLTLALNCGGSDGNSGVTANPALGVASDELVRHGGTSVLAETTEVYGAEHLLTRRAISRAVGERLIERIRWWEHYAAALGATIDNNPSYGNKEGGLTTIYEKSLGAVAKGGTAPLRAVYHYAEPITESGFCFMDTPGYDPVSMTGLVAGGCNIGCFTTGRGSVYGCKPSPCIKIATNTPMYRQLEEDMDINAGTILDGTETLEQVGGRIFELIVRVAGGERTKSELLGMGDEEFAPWLIGPQL